MNCKARSFAWLTVAAIAMAGTASAEGTLSTVLVGTPHQSLFATSFDGEHGTAVGADGEIEVTQDGGKTWKTEQGPTLIALTAVAVKGSRRIILGQMGELYVDDGSGKWRRAQTDTTERMLGASLNASGIALAVGSFGTLLRSTDGGETWKSVAPEWKALVGNSEELADDFAPTLYGVTIDDQGVAVVVGEMSTVLRSEDSGVTWRIVLGGASQGTDRAPTLFGITMRTDGIGYAVGQTGIILQTSDHGRTWCSQDSGTTANLLSVASPVGGRTLVSGIRTMLINTSDGTRWEKLKGAKLELNWYSGAANVGGNEFAVVGQSGDILRVTP
jgi:photosystem II stability/assembly factor-like uncharacterized protein